MPHWDHTQGHLPSWWVFLWEEPRLVLQKSLSLFLSEPFLLCTIPLDSGPWGGLRVEVEPKAVPAPSPSQSKEGKTLAWLVVTCPREPL